METCKYGSGAGKRKPTAVKWKGVVCRAYRLLIPNLNTIYQCLRVEFVKGLQSNIYGYGTSSYNNQRIRQGEHS